MIQVLFELFLAIVADVISYFICKWLDDKDN
ncbi:hypothetical protein SAG0136_00560 [Streptococcus agalactiae LMG 14747]|uniref:Uncharacterized protein n=1 Tax=Streptococcus agalactiae LMG 14747 TaxID=1154860 RepID=V6Z0L7_STRAG|nr:hypothetical protein SAG0136_00560 [Streptococcus agalactiae LMG 14747]